MAYVKQNFQDAQILEASQLNHMEDGIYSVDTTKLNKSGGEVTGDITLTGGHKIEVRGTKDGSGAWSGVFIEGTTIGYPKLIARASGLVTELSPSYMGGTNCSIYGQSLQTAGTVSAENLNISGTASVGGTATFLQDINVASDSKLFLGSYAKLSAYGENRLCGNLALGTGNGQGDFYSSINIDPTGNSSIKLSPGGQSVQVMDSSSNFVVKIDASFVRVRNIVLTAPNGDEYAVGVDNSGQLTVQAI